MEATVEALATEEAAHAAAVAKLAAGIGQRLGFPPELVELLRLAARLHDLGKLGVPPEILAKPGSLSRAERHVVERHSEIGGRMLEALGLPRIAPWVRHHHERWDGLGIDPRAVEALLAELGTRRRAASGREAVVC